MNTDLRLRTALGLAMLLGFGGCVDGDPVGLDTGIPVGLAVVPSFSVAPTEEEVGRLSRARVVVLDALTERLLASLDEEIDPDASEWSFELSLDVTADEKRQIIVTVELFSDIVEWSGQTRPTPLVVGAPTDISLVTLLRGPLDNLAVTGLELLDVPDELDEGARGHLDVRIEGGGEGARAFYSSLTPSVLEVSRDGVFHAIAPGEAEVEARAGAVADTVVILVSERLLEIQEVQTVTGVAGDAADRLAPALQDPAGAQVIVQSLRDFGTAVESRRPERIRDAITAARGALASYGTPEIRYQDGPELSLIELVLDFTERVILGGIGSSSGT